MRSRRFRFILALSLLGSVAGSVFTPAEAGRGAVGVLHPHAALGLVGTDPRGGDRPRSDASLPNRELPARRLQCDRRHHLADGVRGAADLHRDPGLAAGRRGAGIIVVTSTILKFNWYDRLEAT